MSGPRFSSILITGASSGIGRALALRLAAPGARLTLTGRDATRLEEAARACRAQGAEAEAAAVDAADARAMAGLIERADAAAPLDLVIANAGISGGAGTDPDDIDRTRDILAVNVAGVVNTVLPAAAAMRPRRRGRIGIVGSVAGFRGMPTAPAYSASKVAVRAWGEAVRPALGADGIGLSMIHPGFVESRITDANDFPMPLLMPADKAAGIIVRGLEKGRRVIAFPWPTVWAMRLLAALPGPLFDAIMARSPRKR